MADDKALDEIVRLKAQRDDLQARNTELVEERRAAQKEREEADRCAAPARVTTAAVR